MANLNISSTLNGIKNQAVDQIQNMNDAAAKIHTTEVSILHALGDTAGQVVGWILTKNYVKHMRSAVDTITNVRKNALKSLLSNKKFSMTPELRAKITDAIRNLENAQSELAKNPNRFTKERLRIKINSYNTQLTEAIKELPTPTGKAAGASAIEAAKYCNDIFEGKYRMNLPKVLAGEPLVEQAANRLRLGTSKLAKSQHDALDRVAKQALKNPGFKARWGRFYNQAGRFVGPLMIAYSAYDAAFNVVQDEYDPTQQEYINKLSKLMNTDTGDKAYDDLPDDKKRELIDWALKNESDPKEIEILNKIKNNGYNVRTYLESLDPKMKFNVENKDASITEAWINEANQNISNGISAQFYGKLLEQQQQMTKGAENILDDDTLEGVKPIPVPNNPEGPSPESTPEPTPTPTPHTPGSTPEPTPTPTPHTPGSTPEPTPTPTPHTPGSNQGPNNAPNTDDNPPKGSKPKTPKPGSTTNVPPTNVPVTNVPGSVPGQTLSDPDKDKKSTTTNLPPEAIVQQPEEQSFWTWKNILMIGSIVATLGLSTYFIIKYKKKADKAKKETSSLQSTVNDLQSQVDDLKADTTPTTDPTTPTTNDGSSLANSGTNITNSTLDTVNQVLTTNDNSRV